MSKILEYIKLLPKAVANIDKIAESLVYQVKQEFNMLTDEEAEIIAGRRLICGQCPFNSINAIKSHLYKTDRPDAHCIHCGCNITAKTASLSSNCGLETYNSKPENKDNQLPLKWEKTQ